LERFDAGEALRWLRLPERPVILEGWTANGAFAAATTRQRLLESYGHRSVTLTSSNSFSEHESQATLADYAEAVRGDTPANESLYLFGPQPGLDDLLSTYRPPRCPQCDDTAVSFGFAPNGSGVNFHTHGPGFAETIHGQKRWFFFLPSQREQQENDKGTTPPPFDPDAAIRDWVTEVLPSIREPVIDCVIEPGELLFFPAGWWHATLNLDDHTVFVSTFLRIDR